MLADHFAAAGAQLPSHVLPLVPNSHAYEARFHQNAFPSPSSTVTSPEINLPNEGEGDQGGNSRWFGGLFGGWRSQPTSPELGRNPSNSRQV